MRGGHVGKSRVFDEKHVWYQSAGVKVTSLDKQMNGDRQTEAPLLVTGTRHRGEWGEEGRGGEGRKGEGEVEWVQLPGVRTGKYECVKMEMRILLARNKAQEAGGP